MKIEHLITAAALAAAACGPLDPNEELMDPTDPSMSELASARKGIDYAADHPSIASMHAGGYSFVVRYVSHDGSKNISAGEANGLRSSGIDVAIVFEDGAHNVDNGFSQGRADA